MRDRQSRTDPDELEPDPEESEEGDESEREPEEEEPEDAARAPAPVDSVLPLAGVASGGPSVNGDTAPPRADRSVGWLPLSDPRILSLDIQRQQKNAGDVRLRTQYLERVKLPFPPDLRLFLLERHGPGGYTVSERGAGNQYIGARTFHLTMDYPRLNGAAPLSTAEPARAAPAPNPPTVSQDYRVQLIVTGGMILSTILAAVLQPKPTPPPSNSLAEFRELLTLMQVGNNERAQLFKEGAETVRAMMESAGAGGEGGGGFDLNKIADAVTAVASAAAAARPSQPAHAGGGGVHALPAQAAPPVLAAPKKEELTREQLLELAIVAEITRAVERGDSPETLVILLEAWLNPLELAWLQSEDEEAVLAQIPARFPAHTALFQQSPVQTFLRGALQMLRSDDEEQSGVLRVSPAAAGTEAAS